MGSSAPLAVPQFMAIAKAALPTNFQVVFGTNFGVNVQPQALLITGLRFSLDETATIEPRYPHEEHYNILGTLAGVAGGDDQLAMMQEVYALYNDLAVAIFAAPTLNDTVRLAWTRQLDYSPTKDPKGLLVGQLDFEVECQQRVFYDSN